MRNATAPSRKALTALAVLALAVTPGAAAQDTPPYETIDAAAARTYGKGQLSIERVMERTAQFTRTLVKYDSDGQTVYAFMNVPAGRGPFPVVLVLHGYVNPANYRTLTYTTRYADDLARAGFLVIHPNYRGHPPSAGTPEGVWRFGYARDVLHLAAHVREQGGQPGPLEQAAPDRIGLWGHSMGGGIALRAAVIDPDVRAVLLYGSMSGDERKNARQIHEVFTDGQRGGREKNAPQDVVDSISPLRHLDRTRAAFSIHHGTADADVPVAWSRETCDALKSAGRRTECYFYPNGPHLFRGAYDQALRERAVKFFRRELSEPKAQ